MQNLTSTLGRLAVVLAGALALGSCSRAEYAFLPKSASYLGTTTAVPKARRAVAAPTTTVTATPAPEVAATEAPVAAAPTQEVAIAPVAPVPVGKAVAVAPEVKAIAAAPAAATTATPVTTAKPNLVQRLALHKMMRKLDKQAQKLATRKGDNTASTARGGLDSRLRYAIIFGVISLVFFVIGGSVGNLIGAILLIIAILFLLFWLLDNL